MTLAAMGQPGVADLSRVLEAQAPPRWRHAPAVAAVLSAHIAGGWAEVHLRADQSVAYRVVAQALADASKAGLSKVGFVSEPERP